jgi:hypothetical protein
MSSKQSRPETALGRDFSIDLGILLANQLDTTG